MKWLDAVLDLLFPPKCPFCGKVTERTDVCEACERSLPRVPDADTVKTEKGLAVAAPLYYRGAVRDGVLRFKFGGESGCARALGPLLAQCAAERFSGEFDAVTWAPVSRKRLRRRGYDQAKLLAEAACASWGIRPTALLKKIADNPAQSTLRGESARRANVLGVYEPTNIERIRGARVLLVDDVYTTGATVRECERVLRDAGAADVMCVCLARAEAENS